MVVEEEGDEFVQPFELWRDTGQHNMHCGGCEEDKRRCGIIRPRGFMQQYGIGMSLYFKFVKTLNTAFAFAALFASVPCTYYWQTSAWNANAKEIYLSNPATEQKYQFFFTSSGSLLGQSYVCGMGYEDERFELSCPVGVMTRVEAYYGDPLGSCSCPQEQLPLTTGLRAGSCLADVDYSDSASGRCSKLYPLSREDDELEETPMPCFKGQMWTGATCCAYDLTPGGIPDFNDLAFVPSPGCNSASAQFLVQAQCLNQHNCTLDVKSNVTYQWTVTPTAPCAEGTQVRLRSTRCACARSNGSSTSAQASTGHGPNFLGRIKPPRAHGAQRFDKTVQQHHQQPVCMFRLCRFLKCIKGVGRGDAHAAVLFLLHQPGLQLHQLPQVHQGPPPDGARPVLPAGVPELVHRLGKHPPAPAVRL